MILDLTKDDQLKIAIEKVRPFERHPDWLGSLEQLISYVQKTDEAERRTVDFHQRLWEENAVSGVGMGTVNVHGAINDEEFRSWVARQSVRPLGETDEEKLANLFSFYEQLIEKVTVFSGRKPKVKIMRVLAALFPQYFTTITNLHMALGFHKVMFGKGRRPDPIKRQWDIRRRIDQVLGEHDATPRSLAERMSIAWFLYEDNAPEDNSQEDVGVVGNSGGLLLKPLPAVQRRKGFTSIRGGLGTIANAISFVVDGVTREELFDHLKAEFSDYRDSSLRTLVNVLKNEFYVIQEVDGVVRPTPRGEGFLESEDPQELIPLLLTRILGVDHVLKALESGQKNKADLIQMLKDVNPGWSTDFAPSAMLKWLRDFDLITLLDGGFLVLTESGQSWTKAIHWEPEKLAPVEELDIEPALESSKLDVHQVNQQDLIDRVIGKSAISVGLVRQLHVGLWAHPRRHFAMLAGLSGSGKTFLAQRYATALAQGFTETADKNVFILPVQPGWYDPSPLFGYVNPLLTDSYVRPPFLDFLLRASRHPDQPFTVILDEMNLSHPEQYFAPVLSAMESGDRLRLHNEGAVFDGVPSTIAYPSNVAFVGTVNMDETTHGISDKVLDRAYTLEFWQIDLDDYPDWNSYGLAEADLSRVRECLKTLMNVLAPERMHFGWRTVEDVLSYLNLACKYPEFDLVTELDNVIYARVLPKLRGSESQRLHAALDALVTALTELGLPRSSGKVRALQADLIDTGMMRFWR